MTKCKTIEEKIIGFLQREIFTIKFVTSICVLTPLVVIYFWITVGNAPSIVTTCFTGWCFGWFVGDLQRIIRNW